MNVPASASATVLAASDDHEEGAIVFYHLMKAGFTVRLVNSASAVLEQLTREPPDALLLGNKLPQGSHFALVRAIRSSREAGDLPLIALCGPDDDQRLDLIEAGADDALRDTPSPRELVVRLTGLLRRARAAGVSPRLRVLRVGPWSLCPEQLRFSCGGRSWELTPTECRIIAELMSPAGVVRSRAHLCAAVGGRETRHAHLALTMHVKRIRAKLGPWRDVIDTVRGIGYRFRDAPALKPVGTG